MCGPLNTTETSEEYFDCIFSYGDEAKAGGRARAKAVGLWLPTAAARVPSQASSCWFLIVERDPGVGFFRILQFPLPVLLPRNASYSSITRGGTLGQ
jgi:hypothetical protein